MGITIHFNFHAGERSVAEIQDIIESLHQTAEDLPFEVLSEIVELVGDECVSKSPDSRNLLKMYATKRDIWKPDYKEHPVHIIGFTALPRPGTEELDIFLCRYGNSPEWVAEARCKTQYAQLPEHGGTANFVLAHTMIIKLLDKGRELGILERVNDESKFWDNRNPRSLAQSGEDWNTVKIEIGKILEQIPNSRIVKIEEIDLQ